MNLEAWIIPSLEPTSFMFIYVYWLCRWLLKCFHYGSPCTNQVFQREIEHGGSKITLSLVTWLSFSINFPKSKPWFPKPQKKFNSLGRHQGTMTSHMQLTTWLPSTISHSKSWLSHGHRRVVSLKEDSATGLSEVASRSAEAKKSKEKEDKGLPSQNHIQSCSPRNIHSEETQNASPSQALLSLWQP